MGFLPKCFSTLHPFCKLLSIPLALYGPLWLRDLEKDYSLTNRPPSVCLLHCLVRRSWLWRKGIAWVCHLLCLSYPPPSNEAQFCILTACELACPSTQSRRSHTTKVAHAASICVWYTFSCISARELSGVNVALLSVSMGLSWGGGCGILLRGSTLECMQPGQCIISNLGTYMENTASHVAKR